jgi:hypothetical protein
MIRLGNGCGKKSAKAWWNDFFCDSTLEARAKTIEDKVVAGNLSGTAGASRLLDSALKKQP